MKEKAPLSNRDGVCIWMQPPIILRRNGIDPRGSNGISLWRVDDYVFTLGYKTGSAGKKLMVKLFKNIGLDVYSKDVTYAVEETIFVMCNKKQKFSFILKHGPCPKE